MFVFSINATLKFEFSLPKKKCVLNFIFVSASVYSNRLVTFLLQKLESSNEAYRIGSLTVFKHLINSCGRRTLSS